MGKIELVALLCLSSWCLVIVVWLFLTIPRVCLQFVIVVFPDHTHFLFFIMGHLTSSHYNWLFEKMRTFYVKQPTRVE